ncbi:MAG: EutN/CcmL family microcompartment protein [Limnochordia bacterium]|jgi:microcompartment protein CcmK/EutM
MFLAKVIAPVVCSVMHPAFSGKAFLLVEQVEPGGDDGGEYRLAVDYVGAGAGDMVVAGGPPGLGEMLGLPRAPISTWVMAIVERAERRE